MRHAFIATVPICLIEAINFVITNDINDADVYITKSFSHAEDVGNRLSVTGVFKHVYVIDDVLLTYPITIKKCIEMVKNGHLLVKQMKNRKYDCIYYNNSGWLVNSIFYTGSLKGNKKCKQRFIEHGYNTYLNEYQKKTWYMKLLINLTGFNCMDGSMLEALYMFHPDLLKVHQDGEIRVMKPLDINNDWLVNTINHSFGFDPTLSEFRDKEIIIMEQGPQKVEFDMVKFWGEVLNGLKKDNIIIKPHPRQKGSALRKFGIDICENNELPWEVITLNLDLSNKIQFTIFSGSCIYPKLLCDVEPTVVMLYKLLPVDYKYLGEDLVKLSDDIGKKYRDSKKYFVPESFEELRNFCKNNGLLRED